MSKKTTIIKKPRYKDHPINVGKITTDFLPRPEDLILKQDTVKITLALNRDSIEFFKKLAKDNHTQYQKMIRSLLDHYVSFYKAEYFRTNHNRS